MCAWCVVSFNPCPSLGTSMQSPAQRYSWSSPKKGQKTVPACSTTRGHVYMGSVIAISAAWGALPPSNPLFYGHTCSLLPTAAAHSSALSSAKCAHTAFSLLIWGFLLNLLKGIHPKAVCGL